MCVSAGLISPPAAFPPKLRGYEQKRHTRAGSGRRVSTTSRSRSQTPVQVNGELVQRKITFLSGEICRDGMRAVAAPTSKACLKTRKRCGESRRGRCRSQPRS